MDKEEIKEQELRGMFERLDHEVDLLYQAVNDRGDDLDKEYSDKVIRAQIESTAEVLETMSQRVGEGEKISITTPSQLGREEE